MQSSDLLTACQTTIGYQFSDVSLLNIALTHASVAQTRQESNERLEFLGDSALGLAVCMELYRRYPDFCEGELTKIKSAVVSRKTCAAVGRKLGLDAYLVLGKGVRSRENLPGSMIAAAFEAIVGAILLDSNFEAAREFTLRVMMPHIEAAVASKHQLNYKSQLQQNVQKTMGMSPQYQVIEEQGPDHSKCFEIAVTVGERTFRSAWGRSKKEAEQQAAFHALVALGVLDADTETSRQAMVTDPFSFEMSDSGFLGSSDTQLNVSSGALMNLTRNGEHKNGHAKPSDSKPHLAPTPPAATPPSRRVDAGPSEETSRSGYLIEPDLLRVK